MEAYASQYHNITLILVRFSWSRIWAATEYSGIFKLEVVVDEVDANLFSVMFMLLNWIFEVVDCNKILNHLIWAEKSVIYSESRNQILDGRLELSSNKTWNSQTRLNL